MLLLHNMATAQKRDPDTAHLRMTEDTDSAKFVENIALSNHEFKEIAQKLLDSERLSLEDGYKLIRTNEIFPLGHLANYFRQKKSYEVAIAKGFSEQIAKQRMQQVWWNTNLHLNPTNVCIGECDFCSFARRPGEEGAYTMTIPEAVDRVVLARAEGATEVSY